MRNFFSAFLLFLPTIILAQNITGKIIDSRTNAEIAYANISINNSENLMTNAEGFFTLSENYSDSNTMLTISFVGYFTQHITVATLISNKNLIKLEAGRIELAEVNVSNKTLSATEIMAFVKSNFNKNYEFEKIPIKEQIFYRHITGFKPSILEVEIDKSTKFPKEKLREVNKQIASYARALTSSPPKQYADVLFNKYGHPKMVKNISTFETKIDVIKATMLKNENSSTSIEELQTNTMQIFKTLLDTTKFYRAKSGLIGSRDTISFRKNDGRKKNSKKSTTLTSFKQNVSSFVNSNNFKSTTTFDYIHFPEYYEYKYEGASYSDQNEFVYILSFKPDKNKAKYEGKLYINASDFAVVRVDYQLAEGKRVSGVNLRFLLGIKFYDNVRKGTIIFRKDAIVNAYRMQYASQESGQYFYVNRPLKFIELADDDREILAFDFKVEGNINDKEEFLIMNRNASTDAFVEKLTEKEFKYTNIKSYDPKFWKDYSAIEPLEEMKQFKATD